MKLHFRNANMEDYEKMCEVWRKHTFLGNNIPVNSAPEKSEYASWVENEYIYIAETEEKECFGFARVVAYEDGYGKIVTIYVKEHRKGYGKQFVEFLEKEFRACGMEKIELESQNLLTDRFWEKMGFKSVNYTDKYEKEI